MEKKRNLWVIPTDKPSRILFDKEENRLLPLQDSTVFMQYQDLVENQHIYITNDEEIKEGDYVISTYDKWRGDGKLKPQIGEMLEIHNDYYLIDSFNGDTNNRWDKGHSKKIILTTDKDLDGIQAIDDEFLNWFVKNSSCESVEIERSCLDETAFRHNIITYKIIIPNLEIWKDVPSYEGLYQVSNFGNVKSLERYVKGKVENRLQKENILSKRLVGDIGNQYYAVTLCNNKDRKQIKISVLVAMAFLNHTPNGYVGFTVDHIDNNPLNNTVNNLQVITKRENSSKDKKGISKYTGVTFNKKSNKWRSQIWINGKNKTLGSFDDELEAHRAYQKELQQYLKSQ